MTYPLPTYTVRDLGHSDSDPILTGSSSNLSDWTHTLAELGYEFNWLAHNVYKLSDTLGRNIPRYLSITSKR